MGTNDMFQNKVNKVEGFVCIFCTKVNKVLKNLS